jgi:hypothetical protein
MESLVGKIIREAYIPTSSTVYYYPLNGDYTDHSLNNLPDAIDNGCEFVMDAMVGKMIKFDLSGKYLTLPPRTNFIDNLYDKTISYILLARDIYTTERAILNLGADANYYRCCEILFNKIWTSYDGITPIKPCIDISVRSSNGEYSTQMEFQSNLPVLITHTITSGNADGTEGGSLRTYVNGRIINYVHINQPYNKNLFNDNIFLGKTLYTGSDYYSDLIMAEFILEGRVWTEVEVSSYARNIGF